MEEPSPATNKDSEFDRQRHFGETYKAFQNQATSLVGWTRQLKELQARWGSAENQLRTRLREVGEREREVGAREKDLEEREVKSKMEMESQQKEMDSSKSQLLILKPLIVRYEIELAILREAVIEKKKEVDFIEKQCLDHHVKLNCVEKCVEEKMKELEREIELKRGELVAKEILVKECECKDKELKEVQGLIQLKTRELDRILMSLDENTKECDLKGKKVMALEETIRKYEKEMELKREEWSRQIGLKELELESLFGKFELRGKQFEPLFQEIRVIDKRWDGWLNEGLVREGWSQTCEKRKVEEQGKELDLSTECLEPPPATNDMIIAQYECDQLNINRDGRSSEVISGIIRNLITRKHLIKAVILICTFKQIDNFPPVPLLKEFVEDAKKSCIEIVSTEISHDLKEKVVHDLMADLGAVIKCIEDHSLESQYPTIDIVKEIQGLWELKKNLEVVLTLPSNVKEQEQRKGNKRSLVLALPHRSYNLKRSRKVNST